MNTEIKDEYLAELRDDPAKRLMGIICIVVLKSGQTFTGRLIAVLDNELWFESRSKRTWMHLRDSIYSIEPIAKEKGAVV